MDLLGGVRAVDSKMITINTNKHPRQSPSRETDVGPMNLLDHREPSEIEGHRRAFILFDFDAPTNSKCHHA
jgi:hypothetical protein